MPAVMKKLPIGLQNLREMRTQGYVYVDKTAHVARLAEEGKYYFLARPRRFGKSLLVDTLAEAFAGSRELFEGLYLENHWDWSRKYPVLRFDFSQGVLPDRALLDATLLGQLRLNHERYGLAWEEAPVHIALDRLVRNLRQAAGQPVVLLIDEYDKPILDNLQNPEQARAMREGLRNFYSVIKSLDPHLKFVLLTGVSKFSKVSLFSGLNNLEDITIDPRVATLCGYTQAELVGAFAEHLEGVDLAEVKRWYNGYNFLGEPVYNPFDILLYLRHREFKPYWFETGTPTFLIDLLAARGFFTPDLARLRTGLELLSTFDVDHIATEALLFQTGYLTIHKAEEPIRGHWVYTLGYPNHEVEASLNASLLSVYTDDPGKSFAHRLRLLDLLLADNLDGLPDLFHALFASIPHQWYDNNPISRYEGYYASVFYSHFAALGLDIVLEDATNQGRIDMTVKCRDRIYLFEFKVVEIAPEGRALQQLKDRGYAEKYRAGGEPIYLIGVEFSRDRRNLAGFAWERG
jgi:hypothetical protein